MNLSPEENSRLYKELRKLVNEKTRKNIYTQSDIDSILCFLYWNNVEIFDILQDYLEPWK